MNSSVSRPNATLSNSIDYQQLKRKIVNWAGELGFQRVGVSDINLGEAESDLKEWLQRGFHGEMGYMARHGSKRSRPAALVEGTVRVITFGIDYLPTAAPAAPLLEQPAQGYISRYALGRDYHKLVRRRLQQLAKRIEAESGAFGYRVFCDSAPVLEKPLAQRAGLGWIGKHTNLIDRRAGSWFFLGEIYTDLPLPIDSPASDHCGRCHACIDACPTRAIIAPYRLDARLCISYLTIELKGSIPEPLRPLLGNRIYGCDDCQLVCPWNRFARTTAEPDFAPRHALDRSTLVQLFQWSEAEFEQRLAGSAIRRIGHVRWLRNIAVALGNLLATQGADQGVITVLQSRQHHPSELVQDHVCWALRQGTDRGLAR